MKVDTCFSPHPDLLAADLLVYQPNGLVFSSVTAEREGFDYAACTFKINNKTVKFRSAKITPTKIGQFVTLWKRNEQTGETAPYDVADEVDVFIVSARSGERLGQFVFQKNLLLQQGILSSENAGGKRGFRVYPPWDVTDNPTAKKTQAWQKNYFVELAPEVNLAAAKRLLKIF